MKKTAIIGFGLMLLFSFVALNIAVFLFGSAQVFDLTADQRYTLRSSTLNWLAANKQNLYLRLYKSPDLQRINPELSEYTTYVIKMLEQYRLHSDHKLGLQIVEVQPFSVQEAEARSLGIEELTSENAAHPKFLGLVVSDDAGHMRTLPYLNPARRNYLEQDISRLLSNLETGKRTDVGILSPAFKVIPGNDAFDHTAPWPVADFLARDYDLTYVNPNTAQIPFNVDVLLVVNPIEMSNTTLYAIDQFLMYGGKVIMFMDALSEYMLANRVAPPQMLSVSYLPKFLQQLGITFVPDAVVGDLRKNRIITLDGTAEPYPFWLKITPELFVKHQIMDGVSDIAMNSASNLYVSPQPDIQTTVLFGSSAGGVEVNNAELSHRTAEQELRTLRETDGNYPLAVLLEGKFNSYFKVPYINAVKETPFISLSLDKSSLLVVADSDMLLSSTWNANKAARQEWYHMVPQSGNLDFLLNAIDYLAEDTLLSVAPKNSPYARRSLTDVFSAQAHKALADERIKTMEAMSQTEAALQELSRRLESNELMPSLKTTRKLESLQRDKIHQQKEMQRIEYLTTEKYQSIINFFVIRNIGLALGLIAIICLLQELIFCRNRRKAEGYVNE